jgi:cephalosporin hydroxylase
MTQELLTAYWYGVVAGTHLFGQLARDAGRDGIVINSQQQQLTVFAGGVPRTVPLYSPAAFRHISRHWVRVGWALHYYAGFRWMGRHVLQLPEDLFRLQEVVYAVQPDFVVESGVFEGGSTLFLASLCRILGKGRVIGVDLHIPSHVRSALEEHTLAPYITLIQGDSVSNSVVDAVKSMCSPGTVMVLLDSAHDAAHVRRELEVYSPLISPGSYLIVEDGIMHDLCGVPGGDPTWLFDNPAAAIIDFLATHPEFQISPPHAGTPAAGGVSYWPWGWLKKTVCEAGR